MPAVSKVSQADPNRILLVTLRFLGDVLLTTPLLHSLKQSYPDAKIDILVFQNTSAMLTGNNDINQIIVTPIRPTWADTLQLIRQIFRRYDLAMAVQTGDRPFLYCLLASSRRIAAVPPSGSTGWWKRFFLQGFIEFDNDNTHTVLQHLKLLEPLKIPPCYDLVPPKLDNPDLLIEKLPILQKGNGYVVIHPFPQWRYKRWSIENWVEIGQFIQKSGFCIILSGGPSPDELDYVAKIDECLLENKINLAGRLTLGELAHVIAGAKCFVGPDTGITHLAAAVNAPVIALFGPTNPVKWAPWPYHYRCNRNPFSKTGDQQIHNVMLIQGTADCVPCDQEGCDRHRQSRSRCLDELSVQRVKESVLELLTFRD